MNNNCLPRPPGFARTTVSLPDEALLTGRALNQSLLRQKELRQKELRQKELRQKEQGKTNQTSNQGARCRAKGSGYIAGDYSQECGQLATSIS